MAKDKRRANFTAEEKVGILREHLLEKVPVSVAEAALRAGGEDLRASAERPRARARSQG
jgi:hypothetical protein